MKPLLKFDHGLKEKPVVTNVEKRVNVEMKNITIPRLMEDKTSRSQHAQAYCHRLLHNASQLVTKMSSLESSLAGVQLRPLLLSFSPYTCSLDQASGGW